MNLGLVHAALDELRTHKSRLALSVSTIVVGIASLVLIVAIGEVGRGAAIALLERQTGRAATLDVTISRLTPDAASIVDGSDRLADRLKRYGARAVTRIDVGSVRIASDAGRVSATLLGVDVSFAVVRRVRVDQGRWITEHDSSLFAPVVVVNHALRDIVGLGPSDPSQTIALVSVESVAARIVGVVDDGSPEPQAYIPIAHFRSWFSEYPLGTRLLAWIDPQKVDVIAQQVVRDARAAGMEAETRRLDDPNAVNDTVLALQVGLGGIAALSLLSGGLGILNLGLVTVGHRAREFALRRAFGATKRDLWLVVLMESLGTSLLAGIIGLGLAWLGVVVVSLGASRFLEADDIPGFPLIAAVVAVLVAAAIGLAAGVAPAVRASRASIIQVMRE